MTCKRPGACGFYRASGASTLCDHFIMCKYPEAAEQQAVAPANAAQQVKSAIELLRWVILRVGNHTTTGEWHKWLSDADKYIADNGGY